MSFRPSLFQAVLHSVTARKPSTILRHLSNPNFQYFQYFEPFARLEKDLSQRGKGDKGKVKLVRRLLRGETPMTLRWITDRLRTGSWTCVLNLLCEKQ
jgi:hypothetical protein